MKTSTLRRAHALVCLGILIVSGSACNLIVGIEDIEGNAGSEGDGVSSCKSPNEIKIQLGDALGHDDADSSQGQDLLNTDASPCVQAKGRERIYRLQAESSGLLTAAVRARDAAYDTVLYARKNVCNPDPMSVTWCADNKPIKATSFSGETLSMPVQAMDQIDIVVDGYGNDDFGPFDVTFSLKTGLDCKSPVPITLDPGGKATLDTFLPKDPSLTGQDFCGQCDGNTCAGKALQTIYQINATEKLRVTAAVDSKLDTVLYVRSDCTLQTTQLNGSQGCADKTGLGTQSGETLEFVVDANAPVFLFVDYGGLLVGEGGAATVVLKADAP